MSLWGHVFGQACSFRFAVGCHRFFNLMVDLLLSAIGGGDKVVKTAQLEEKTGQANAARPNLASHQH
jgi:hypothetical protein